MWAYEQATGRLLRDGELVATGYSGHGDGRNNPAREAIPNVGPIPRGRWRFGAAHDTETHGPQVLPLFPCGANTHGRAGFLVHGDSRNSPGTASLGCIVMPRAAREAMAASEDRELEVV